MRPFLILASIANVALAALSGFAVAQMPGVFDTGGVGAGVESGAIAHEYSVPFALVAAFPVFCLIAAALPLLLHGRGRGRAALAVALLPAIIAGTVLMFLTV